MDQSNISRKEIENYQEKLQELEQGNDKYTIIQTLNKLGGLYQQLGNYSTAIEYFLRSLSLSQEMKESTKIAWILGSIGSNYRLLGNFNRALHFFKRKMTLEEELNTKKSLAWTYGSIGMVYRFKGELDAAMTFFERKIEIEKELNNQANIAWTLGSIGMIYRLKGDLNHALQYFLQKLTIDKELDITGNVSWTLGYIGTINRLKGDLNQALEHFIQKLALDHKLGNNVNIAWSRTQIGKIHSLKGNLDLAIEHSKASLTLRQELGNPLDIAESLFQLFLIYNDNQEFNQAHIFLKQLQRIQEKSENKIVDQMAQIALALSLKLGSRLSQKVQAQEILVQVTSEEVVDHELTVFAMLNLCELLLDELKFYGEIEVFQQVKLLLQKIQTTAQKQQSSQRLVQSLILKAKFALIEGKVQNASDILDEAQQIVIERGLNQIRSQITREQEYLRKEYEKWSDFLALSTPLKERIEQAKLAEYIALVKNIRD